MSFVLDGVKFAKIPSFIYRRRFYLFDFIIKRKKEREREKERKIKTLKNKIK